MDEPGTVEGRRAVRWIGYFALGLLTIFSVLLFLQTRDVTQLLLLLVVAVLAVTVYSAAWVHGDARARGLPPAPWAIVTLFAPVAGLIAYLVVREMRPTTR